MSAGSEIRQGRVWSSIGQIGHPILQPQCFISIWGEHVALGEMGFLQELSYVRARMERAVVRFGALPVGWQSPLTLRDKDSSREECVTEGKLRKENGGIVASFEWLQITVPEARINQEFPQENQVIGSRPLHCWVCPF